MPVTPTLTTAVLTRYRQMVLLYTTTVFLFDFKGLLHVNFGIYIHRTILSYFRLIFGLENTEGFASAPGIFMLCNGTRK